MTHRSRNPAAVLTALLVGACSVYGPSDLPLLDNGGAGSVSSKGGSGGRASGGASVTSGGITSMQGGETSLGGTGSGGKGGATSGAGGSGGAQPVNGGRASGGAPVGGTESGGGGGGGLPTGGIIGSGGKQTGGLPSTGGAAPAVPPQLIDDMEDTDGQLYIQEGRDGYWYTSADTVGSTVDPAQGKSISMALLPSGDTGAGGGSTHAFHFSGKAAASSVEGVWGALGGFDLIATTGSVKHPYDAHVYKGLHFWAKAAAGVTITVRLPIRDTTLNAEGAKCGTKCEDHWSKKQVLTTSWALYEMAWPDTKGNNGWAQNSWGYVAPFDATTLVGVQFVITPGLTADVWVDDVSFIP